MLESPLYHYTLSLRRHLREFNRSWSWAGGPAQSATSWSASSVKGAWKLLLQHNGVESVRHMLVEKLYLCFMSFLLATSCQFVSLRSFSLVVVNWSCPSYAIGGTRGNVNPKRIEPLWIFKEVIPKEWQSAIIIAACSCPGQRFYSSQSKPHQMPDRFHMVAGEAKNTETPVCQFTNIAIALSENRMPPDPPVFVIIFRSKITIILVISNFSGALSYYR